MRYNPRLLALRSYIPLFPMFHDALHDYRSNFRGCFLWFCQNRGNRSTQIMLFMCVYQWQRPKERWRSQSGSSRIMGQIQASNQEPLRFAQMKMEQSTAPRNSPTLPQSQRTLQVKNIICCISKIFYYVGILPYQFTNCLCQDPHYAIYFRLFPSKISRENAKKNKNVEFSL